MDSVLNSMGVTAIFFAVAVGVGHRLERSPKPYGLAILAIHITLFVLISGGIIASIYKIQGVTEAKLFSTISLYVAAMTLLGNLVIGTSMAIAKQKNKKLILAHKLSTSLMAIAIFAGIVFMILKT